MNTTTTYKLSSLTEALSALLERRIVLVVDDFHYIEKDSRTEFMRNVKGAVYAGLKILLLSVTHRAFDAIKAESELTGRFTSVSLPKWTNHDLLRIPELGFEALKTKYSKKLIERLAREAQDSPFLTQTFCWELCFDSGIEKPKFVGYNTIPDDYDVEPMFIRIAENAGLPIYQRLVAGPQSRKIRQKRPLRNGDEADIYEATLIALAETGPKASVKYDELRATLNTLLVEMMPQKHEITSALKHLARISVEAGTESAIDWDEEKREVNIADPYLRFFLRWQVRWRDGAS